jgi:alcohol dehydrogenase (NADP+)
MKLLSRRAVLSTAAAAAVFSSPQLPQAMAMPSPTLMAATEERHTLTLRSGAKMPLVGLGTWESAPGEVGAAVEAALASGCRHIDCAAAYRNEKEVGAALKASGVPRDDIFLTSKLWNDRRRPADVRAALDKTLSDLGTDHLDLYLIHWPVVWQRDSVMKADAAASLRECWQTLEALHDEGKVRNIGVSNYKEAELEELLDYARIRPAINQIELHPRLPQTSLVQYCQAKGIGVTAYSPLGRGNVKAAGLLSNPTVASIAETHAVSPASVLLRWNLQRDVVVIPKSVSPARIAQNVQQPWSFRLTAEETAALDALEDGGRFCTAPWSTFDDKTRSERLVSAALTGAARVIFSVASLDITRR